MAGYGGLAVAVKPCRKQSEHGLGVPDVGKLDVVAPERLWERLGHPVRFGRVGGRCSDPEAKTCPEVARAARCVRMPVVAEPLEGPRTCGLIATIAGCRSGLAPLPLGPYALIEVTATGARMF